MLSWRCPVSIDGTALLTCRRLTAYPTRAPARPIRRSPTANMTVAMRHAILRRRERRWLIDACNPLNLGASALGDLPYAQARDVLHAAELHGVLPIVLRRVRQIETIGKRSDNGGYAALAEAIAVARRTMVAQAGMEMLLQHNAKLILQDLTNAGLKAIVVKGPTFARRLYAEPALRCFTDIDILIPADSRFVVSERMGRLGFRAVEREYRGTVDYFEDAWLLKDDERVSIEVHSNLAHNPKLRRFNSITFEDVMAAGAGDPEDATALLFIAAAHGALSHQFDRLQHVVDVALAAPGAAGPIDSQRLKSVANRSGVLRAVISALVLANRMFACDACLRLAEEMDPSLFDRMAARLVSPDSVVMARSAGRGRSSWRRKALRQTLRLGAPVFA